MTREAALKAWETRRARQGLATASAESAIPDIVRSGEDASTRAIRAWATRRARLGLPANDTAPAAPVSRAIVPPQRDELGQFVAPIVTTRDGRGRFSSRRPAESLDVLRELRRLARLGDDDALRAFFYEHTYEISEAFAPAFDVTPRQVWEAVEQTSCLSRQTAGAVARVANAVRQQERDQAREVATKLGEQLVTSAREVDGVWGLDLDRLRAFTAPATGDDMIGFWFGDECVAVDRRRLREALRAVAAFEDAACSVSRDGILFTWRSGSGRIRLLPLPTGGRCVLGVRMA